MALPVKHFQHFSVIAASEVQKQIVGLSSPLCQASAAWLPLHRSSTAIPAVRPFKFKRLSGMNSLKLLATPEENSSTEASSESDKKASPVSNKKAAEREAVKKGQATAIVTGTVAVLLGVGYLILVQLLDSRGINLVPPPPEAFDL